MCPTRVPGLRPRFGSGLRLLPNADLVRQQARAQVGGSLPPAWRPGWSPALARPSPSHRGHLGSEPAGRNTLLLCLSKDRRQSQRVRHARGSARPLPGSRAADGQPGCPRKATEGGVEGEGHFLRQADVLSQRGSLWIPRPFRQGRNSFKFCLFRIIGISKTRLKP